MSVVIEPQKRAASGQRFRVDSNGNGSSQRQPSPPPRRDHRNKILLGAVLVPAGALLIAAAGMLAGDLGQPDQPLIYYTVTRGDLPITVTERGNLESQNNVDVICEVDDIHGDNINGTSILFIVPNGSSVKKGDLLVQLDTSGHQDRLDEQVLDTEKARAEKIQAGAKFENQKTQNETAEAEAELQVKLAELELEMFQDDKKGTHQLEVEEIERLIEDINNEILAAKANLELKKNEKQGIERLFRLGYAGKSELDRSRLEFLNAESAYAAQINKLTTQMRTLEKKQDYEKRMQLMTLEGAVQTAKRTLTQVIRDNQALLDQTEAASFAADEAFKKEEELLTRYREQVKNCEIHAPQDGMVAYAVSNHRWHVEIRQGAPVSPRQRILTIPSLSEMQVETAVHESVLDEVKQGLPATIRVDAFPGRNYRGTVESVAVLPDQGGWMSSDTKVYETTITIDEEVQQLKPGMTAVVEIHVDRLRDVVSVPVQAIVQIEDESWCYVDAGGSIERRVLDLGRTNGKFVEIRNGIDEGDRVVLNPMAIVDESKRDESSISPDEDTREPTAEDQPQASPSDKAGDPLKKRDADRTKVGSPSVQSSEPAATAVSQ